MQRIIAQLMRRELLGCAVQGVSQVVEYSPELMSVSRPKPWPRNGYHQ